MTDVHGTSRILTLVFTDLAGSAALNAVSLGHLDEARAAIVEARRVQPNLSLEMIQRGFGVSRPELDARRNAALREAGLE
jgi:hypothetical protein